MKTLVTLVFGIWTLSSFAQSDSTFHAPHFVKTAVANTGCFVYFPDDQEVYFSLEYSPDSAQVYTGEVLSGDYHYAAIVIKFNGLTLENTAEKEEMITSYLDYLQSTFGITAAAGYGKGHTHDSDTQAAGIIDYWEDDDGDEWTVKAWANASTLAVLMIYGPESYPNYSVAALFLNGIRFE